MKNIGKIILVFLSLGVASLQAAAQNINVSGLVTAASDGLPLIGAAVYEEGNSGNGTITDVDGKFTLMVPQGASVTFASIGFKTITLPAQVVMDVILADDTELLDEIVVTGYTTQRKADLTGAVSVVNVDDLSKQNENNPIKALQGRVPGMNITADGGPSGAATVRIRGGGHIEQQ